MPFSLHHDFSEINHWLSVYSNERVIPESLIAEMRKGGKMVPVLIVYSQSMSRVTA